MKLLNQLSKKFVKLFNHSVKSLNRFFQYKKKSIVSYRKAKNDRKLNKSPMMLHWLVPHRKNQSNKLLFKVVGVLLLQLHQLFQLFQHFNFNRKHNQHSLVHQ
ncbi:hypothetical protein DERF_002636 [Dermatophagoides farinae]|uniref:Uncharacterized protein n=1 Tax=Dermatophagoides farinae TaxID=6954 RepID=A0A922IDA5_DERFA|nr:hypothetical protein DERF_002636 [Dermatophagoides farinae]